MSDPCFTDKNRAPTEESIREALGRAASAWRALFDELHAEQPELLESWRYYADGKSWLLKVTRKSKTIFWLSVAQNGFRLAFYFPERLTPALLESELSEERKAELRDGEPTGKLRRVAVSFGPKRGVRDVMVLVALKQRLK